MHLQSSQVGLGTTRWLRGHSHPPLTETCSCTPPKITNASFKAIKIKLSESLSLWWKGHKFKAKLDESCSSNRCRPHLVNLRQSYRLSSKIAVSITCPRPPKLDSQRLEKSVKTLMCCMKVPLWRYSNRKRRSYNASDLCQQCLISILSPNNCPLWRILKRSRQGRLRVSLILPTNGALSR